MENAVGQLENENIAFKTQIDLLQKEFQRIKETVGNLYPRELKRCILNEKGEVEEYTETYANPEEYIESERKFVREVLLRERSKNDRERLKNAEFVLERTGKMSSSDINSEPLRPKQKRKKRINISFPFFFL